MHVTPPPSESAPEIAAHSIIPFDHADLLDRIMGNEAVAEIILQGFLEDMPRQLAALRRYLDASDIEQATRQAHTIKGAAANVGGSALRAVALTMETAGRNGDLDGIQTHFDTLEATFAQLQQAIEQWRCRYNHPN